MLTKAELGNIVMLINEKAACLRCDWGASQCINIITIEELGEILLKYTENDKLEKALEYVKNNLPKETDLDELEKIIDQDRSDMDIVSITQSENIKYVLIKITEIDNVQTEK